MSTIENVSAITFDTGGNKLTVWYDSNSKKVDFNITTPIKFKIEKVGSNVKFNYRNNKKLSGTHYFLKAKNTIVKVEFGDNGGGDYTVRIIGETDVRDLKNKVFGLNMEDYVVSMYANGGMIELASNGSPAF
ncbi:MAG: hypothetical protein AAF502_18055 [Bacteroidota bacterium]